MLKKHIKKIRKYRYVAVGTVLLLIAFLYFKIVYFPSRTDFAELSSMMITQGDIIHADKISIDALSTFTGDYIVSTNTLDSLQRFYTKTHDEKVGISLIHMYVTHYQFDDAFALIKDIYHNNIDFSLIPAQTFLYVLFNSSELSPSRYEVIKGILNDYKEHVRIDDETYTLYSSLLAVYADDTGTFYKGIQSLSGSKQYETLVQGIAGAQKAGASVGGAPLQYYIDGLSATVLLQQGYFRVAQKWAVSIRQKDQKYILPYQILAQAALLQSHRQEAAQYFDTLLKIDATRQDQYQFGLCASYFRQNQYDQALLHCNQVEGKTLLGDATKYVLLSYYQTKNWQGMMDTFQMMLAKQKLTENDYYTFFDIVFFQPFVSDKDFSHTQKYYVSSILPYLDHCVMDFGASSDVCKYGQAGFYLSKDQLGNAYKYLLMLASHHPSSYILRALGQYYESIHEESKAKAYYLKAMTTAAGAVIDISSDESLTGNAVRNY